MIQHRILATVLILAAACASDAASARNPKPANAPKAEAAKAATGVPVEYAELETQVGAEIAVETTLNTLRRGTLIKYTNPALTLKLGPEMGSIDFTIPHDTVRSITLIKPASAPEAREGGSAQKN